MPQPKRKSEFVTVERVYWTCNIEKHRHKTEEIAARCTDRLHSAGQRTQKKWTDDLLARVAARKRAGEPTASLASEFGVSRGRICQIIRKAEFKAYMREHQMGPFKAPT